ncbi:Ku protein [Niveispirillum sp. KHB5.9]|uniref:Ku protein n=1 Tax=Niveispirillum sp. KHB5.9 TaxID=3400269 RepID=UPI003A85DF93
MGECHFWKGYLKLSMVDCPVALVAVNGKDHAQRAADDVGLKDGEPEEASDIDIDLFAPRDLIDWIWLDTPYFLVPGDHDGEDAFAIIREAMKASDAVGIARLRLNGRERAVMLDPRGKAILFWTLRDGDAVHDAAGHFKQPDTSPPETTTGRLLESLVRRDRHPVPDKLLSMIERRRKVIGAHRQHRTLDARGDNIIDIKDALHRRASVQ